MINLSFCEAHAQLNKYPDYFNFQGVVEVELDGLKHKIKEYANYQFHKIIYDCIRTLSSETIRNLSSKRIENYSLKIVVPSKNIPSSTESPSPKSYHVHLIISMFDSVFKGHWITVDYHEEALTPMDNFVRFYKKEHHCFVTDAKVYEVNFIYKSNKSELATLISVADSYIKKVYPNKEFVKISESPKLGKQAVEAYKLFSECQPTFDTYSIDELVQMFNLKNNNKNDFVTKRIIDRIIEIFLNSKDLDDFDILVTSENVNVRNNFYIRCFQKLDDCNLEMIHEQILNMLLKLGVRSKNIDVLNHCLLFISNNSKYSILLKPFLYSIIGYRIVDKSKSEDVCLKDWMVQLCHQSPLPILKYFLDKESKYSSTSSQEFDHIIKQLPKGYAENLTKFSKGKIVNLYLQKCQLLAQNTLEEDKKKLIIHLIDLWLNNKVLYQEVQKEIMVYAFETNREIAGHVDNLIKEHQNEIERIKAEYYQIHKEKIDDLFSKSEHYNHFFEELKKQFYDALAEKKKKLMQPVSLSNIIIEHDYDPKKRPTSNSQGSFNKRDLTLVDLQDFKTPK